LSTIYPQNLTDIDYTGYAPITINGVTYTDETPRLLKAFELANTEAASGAGTQTIVLDQIWNLSFPRNPDGSPKPRQIFGQYEIFPGLVAQQSNIHVRKANNGGLRVIDIPNVPGNDHYAAIVAGVPRATATHNIYDVPFLENLLFEGITIDGSLLTEDQAKRLQGSISGGLSLTRTRHSTVRGITVKHMNGFTGAVTFHVGSERLNFFDSEIENRLFGVYNPDGSPKLDGNGSPIMVAIGHCFWGDGLRASSFEGIRVRNGNNGFNFAVNHDFARASSGNLFYDCHTERCSYSFTIHGSNNRIADCTSGGGTGVIITASLTVPSENNHVENLTHTNAAFAGVGVEIRGNLSGQRTYQNTVKSSKFINVQDGAWLYPNAHDNTIESCEFYYDNRPRVNLPPRGVAFKLDGDSATQNTAKKNTTSDGYIAEGWTTQPPALPAAA
jgi:hypothetical protein